MEEKQVRELVEGRTHYRMASLTREAINAEKRTVELSFASETPVERYWGFEILDHSPASVRLERWKNKPPFMQNHWDRRGVIENGRIENKKLVGTARLSRNAKALELFNDIQDEIAVHTSVGYIVTNAREMKPEEMDENLKAKCLEAGVKAYRCEWEPLEGSSVDIPADISVGLGKRSLDYYDLTDISSPAKVLEQVRSFTPPPNQSAQAESQSQTAQRSITMSEQTKPQPTPEEVRKAERDRQAGIREFAARFTGKLEKIDELRDQALSADTTVEEFKGQLADTISKRPGGEPVFTPDTQLGLSRNEVKEFSLLRVIQAQIPGTGVKAEFEREVSDELRKKTGKSGAGFSIPWEIQNRSMSHQLSRGQLQQLRSLAIQAGLYQAARDLTVGGSTQGAELVGTTLSAANFIDLLRNRIVSSRVGVQILTGLVGNFAMPKLTGASTWVWTGESGSATESTPATSSITLSPKEGGAFVQYSTMLLKQSTPSVEVLVQNDLFAVAGIGVDLAVFHGTAASNQPRGIANESGVGAVTGTAIGWAAVVEFQTDVMSGNADAATMAYVTNPTVLGLLKTRPMFANSPLPIAGLDNMVNGYPLVVSNQISAGHVFFGDFSHEILGYWGGFDVIVNPYTNQQTGLINVSIRADVDCRLRQAGAVSVSSDVD